MVAIPIAIHLLTRLRRRPQPWAAMRFILEAYKKQRQRMQIEQWLLLVVRCLILLVLGLALSGPMLGGCARAFGVDAAGRVVCIVIDDSLSTRAELDAQRSRFDELRAEALRLVEHLRAADRVAIIRAAHPFLSEIAPPTLDHAQARDALTQMKPRYSGADWPGALAAASDLLKQQNVSADRGAVVMLSDFAGATLDLDHPPAAQITALGERARVLVARPMSEAGNVQVASLTPRRQMIVTGSAGGAAGSAIPVEMRLRRFGPQSTTESTIVDVALLAGGAEQPIANVQRGLRWSAGQTEATLNFGVPIPAGAAAGAGGGGAAVVIRARIQSGQANDAIEADNQRLAVIELRTRLRVGVIDEPASARPAGGDGLRPGEWVELALTPGAERGAAGPIEPVPLDAPSVDERALAPLDAALVLRPDLLGPRGWAALRGLAERGGLAWNFMPSVEGPVAWGAALHDRLGLDWKLGVEVQAAPEASPWTLVETPAPEPLSLISADWPALLKPIRVHRRVEATGAAGESVWASMRSPSDPPATPAAPWLVSAPLGDGRVLLLTTAIDTAWSNLPTQPLFVPLMHETLRGVLGSAGDALRLAKLTAGDRPLLGRRWEGARQLVAPAVSPIPLSRNDAGLEPATPLEMPGIYTAEPTSGLKLAVNPAAGAGNTRALDSDALARWLNHLGNWSWLDPARPEAALLAEAPRTDLGWPLLWAVLGLLLVETALARWFSHAQK
jgi:hypothetical protein